MRALRVDYLARIEDKVGIHGPLDGLHDRQLALGRKLFHIFLLFRADAVLAGQSAADAVGVGIYLLM